MLCAFLAKGREKYVFILGINMIEAEKVEKKMFACETFFFLF